MDSTGLTKFECWVCDEPCMEPAIGTHFIWLVCPVCDAEYTIEVAEGVKVKPHG